MSTRAALLSPWKPAASRFPRKRFCSLPEFLCEPEARPSRPALLSGRRSTDSPLPRLPFRPVATGKSSQPPSSPPQGGGHSGDKGSAWSLPAACPQPPLPGAPTARPMPQGVPDPDALHTAPWMSKGPSPEAALGGPFFSNGSWLPRESGLPAPTSMTLTPLTSLGSPPSLPWG